MKTNVKEIQLFPLFRWVWFPFMDGRWRNLPLLGPSASSLCFEHDTCRGASSPHYPGLVVEILVTTTDSGEINPRWKVTFHDENLEWSLTIPAPSVPRVEDTWKSFFLSPFFVSSPHPLPRRSFLISVLFYKRSWPLSESLPLRSIKDHVQ